MVVRCYIALKGFADSLVKFSEDPVCRTARAGAGPGMSRQDWDFIAMAVMQINEEADRLMADVEACAGVLNRDN